MSGLDMVDGLASAAGKLITLFLIFVLLVLLLVGGFGYWIGVHYG